MSDTPNNEPANGAGDDGDTTSSSDIQIQDEMERSFLDYSMSVIMSRALPDVRDGLKPVHRRIIWDMHEQGFRPDRPHEKCARVTGHTMGNFHPHGNSAIYDALVRMAQPFSLRHPLIDFHGTYPPAASVWRRKRRPALWSASTPAKRPASNPTPVTHGSVSFMGTRAASLKVGWVAA